MTELRRLLDWLERGGGTVSALDVVDDEEGEGERTVVARRKIKPGSVVLRIPRRRMITVEDAGAAKAPIGRCALERGIELVSNHSLLAAFLMHERGLRSSSWRPYLDTLPASFAHLPIRYGEAERRLLVGSLAGERLAAQAASIAKDYHALRGGVPGFAAHTHDEFLDARLTVVSRVFGVRVDGKPSEALVPLADMMNHRQPPDATWEPDADAGFVMTARRAVATGVVVHDSYGSKCNSRLFVSYGFTIPDNDADEALLDLPEPPDDGRFAAPAAGDWGEPRAGTRRFLVSARFGPPTRALLSFLRLACATPDEAQAVAPLLAEHTGPLPPIGSRNERAALDALQQVAAGALGRFATIVTEDDPRLTGPSSRAMRNCLLALRGEQRVLGAYRDLAEQALPLLYLTPRELAHAVAARRPGRKLVDRYLADLVAHLPGQL